MMEEMFRKALSCAVALTDSSSLAAMSRRCAAISARARSILSRKASQDLVGSAGVLAAWGGDCSGCAGDAVASAGVFVTPVGLVAVSAGLVGSAGTWAWAITENDTETAKTRKSRLKERNLGNRLRFTTLKLQTKYKSEPNARLPANRILTPYYRS